MITKYDLANTRWRLNNLYYIRDKQGYMVQFKMNWAQERLYADKWYCNIVLKARQLGMSTFICLLLLDKTLFNSGQSAGIIAHTIDDGQYLFAKIKFAYDNLPPEIKQERTADNNTAQMLKFSNGSSIRVGTSLRSSTFQYLHISEFGKICAKYPEKAREIITGSLNTLATGQFCFIESTAEGREGYFYDMCKQAQANRDSKKPLSELDFKFHFFPWYGEKYYRLPSSISIGEDHQNYFASLTSIGINLEDDQKAWYVNKWQSQKDDMKREYPSTPDECWETSNEGTYYAKYLTNARLEKRICHIGYEESLPVHTAWDLGYNDSTAIWFFQIFGKEIRLIEYLEGAGESLVSYIRQLKDRPYSYGYHLAPHDISVHELGSGMTRQAIAYQNGISFIPVQKLEIIAGIDAVRNILNNCWFDDKKCEKGLFALDNYRKDWDDRHGCWLKKPLHNFASHGADAMRCLAVGLPYITAQKSPAELQRERMAEMRDASGQYPGSFLYTPDKNKGVPEYRKRFF